MCRCRRFGNLTAVSGAENDRQIRFHPQYFPGQIDPRHSRHGLIRDHKIEGVGLVLECGQGLYAARQCRYCIAQSFQERLAHSDQGLFVVNKENAFCADRDDLDLFGGWRNLF